MIKKYTRLLPVAVAALAVLILFLFSAQEGEESYGISMKLSNWFIINLVDPLISYIKDTNRILLAYGFHTLVRKFAHLFVFFSLAILFPLVLKLCVPRLNKPLVYIVSFAVIALLAALDELHQFYVPGRDGNLMDVFIDLSGAAFGYICIGLHYLVNRISGFLYRHMRNLTPHDDEKEK